MKIDFNLVDDPGPSRLESDPLNVAINASVERAVAATARLGRAYLGASVVGHSCSRQTQFDWWCTSDLPARVRLIFDRGHLFETLIRNQLLLAKYAFAPVEALEFVALDGYLKGHADGIIIAGPPLPGAYLQLPCIWECKALNNKNYRAVARNGFSVTFPRYAVQIALYQHFLDKKNAALVSCVNADTCEVLHIALPYDAKRVTQAIGVVELILGATRKGELLPRAFNSPDNWHCRICAHRARCWGAK
jgi:hypothetical protein